MAGQVRHDIPHETPVETFDMKQDLRTDFRCSSPETKWNRVAGFIMKVKIEIGEMTGAFNHASNTIRLDRKSFTL
jgi:hypothetical protein